MRLVSVYRLPKIGPKLLFELLQERTSDINISHRRMPTWKQHVRFVASRPYSAWYMIACDCDHVGAIYLTRLDEIGISIFVRYREHGYGPRAVRLLMDKHPRKRYLANTNPRNERSIRMFLRMGFRMIQQTYELRR
jgi:RimJ/RimL family protein N-acetyltransferase